MSTDKREGSFGALPELAPRSIYFYHVPYSASQTTTQTTHQSTWIISVGVELLLFDLILDVAVWEMLQFRISTVQDYNYEADERSFTY